MTTTSTTRKLLGDVGSTFATRILILPIAMATSIVVSRQLGPGAKGAYTTAQTLGEMFATFGALGVTKAVVVYLARDTSDHRIRDAALQLTVAAAVLVAAVLILIASLHAVLFKHVAESVLIAAAPYGAFTLLRGTFESFLRAERRVRTLNVSTLVGAVLLLAGSVALVAAGALTAATAVYARALAALLPAAGLALWLGRGRRGRLGRLPRAQARMLLLYGLPFVAISISQTLNYRADYLMLQAISGSKQVGQYSIAVSLGELLWYLPLAVNFVVFPHASASTDDRSVVRQTTALLRWTLLLTLLAAVGLLVLGDVIVRVMYGHAFGPAAQPLRLLLPGLVANVYYQALGGVLAAKAQLKPLAWATALGLLANIALNAVLIPALGNSGAAIASSVSYTLVAVFVVRLFVRTSDARLRDLLLPSWAEIRRTTARIRGGSRT